MGTASHIKRKNKLKYSLKDDSVDKHGWCHTCSVNPNMMGTGFPADCGKGENRTSWGYCLPECKFKSNYDEMQMDLGQPEILHEKTVATYVSLSKSYPFYMDRFCPVLKPDNEFCVGHAAMSPYTQIYRLGSRRVLEGRVWPNL